MIEYIKFWLAKELLEIALVVCFLIAVGICLGVVKFAAYLQRRRHANLQ